MGLRDDTKGNRRFPQLARRAFRERSGPEEKEETVWDIKPAEITDILRREIKEYGREIDVAETGTVLSIGDGIARVYGLESAMAGELVEFPGGISGMVLNLEEDNVGIAVMGEAFHVREGDVVRRTNRIIEVPVGEALVGRVVDALGDPIDGGAPIESTESRRV